MLLERKETKMSLLVSHRSAVEYWRKYELRLRKNLNCSRISKAPMEIDAEQITVLAALTDLTYPIELLVADSVTSNSMISCALIVFQSPCLDNQLWGSTKIC